VLKAAPYLMKGLSVAGTIAMFLVGGGILTHGVPVLHHWIEQTSAMAGSVLAPLVSMGLDGAVGIAVGALVLAGVTGVQRVVNACATTGRPK
jgi:predicted DNA repair protein MutK